MKGNQIIHKGKKRNEIYTACENWDFHWDLKDIRVFDRMWIEGMDLEDIAKAFERDIDEVALLAMDRKKQGKIEQRKNGIFGRRMPSEHSQAV